MLNNFENSQDDYFASSCKKRYDWQTQNAFVSEAERKLLSFLPITTGIKVLELGCGTGSNLSNLKVMGKTFEFTGLDINDKEIELARKNFPTEDFIIGDATNVTLPNELFDLVFCRDVIHHIQPTRQVKLIQEMARLVKVGGKVVVIESNGLNFVIWAFGKLVKAEQYLPKSTPRRIAGLIQQVESLEQISPTPEFVEPWNFFRFILHYSFGLPWLARIKPFREVLELMIRLFTKITPPHTWAYMVFTTVRKD